MLIMYYHNSPTTANIKRLKAARAIEMKQLNKQAKTITAKYNNLLNELEKLREIELVYDASNGSDLLSNDERAILSTKIDKKRAILTRKTNKITSDK